MLLGITLVGGCALAAALALSQLSGSTSVLALARDVPAGKLLEAADLKVVEMGNSTGVSSVAATDQDRLLGRPAAVPLLAGTLLTRQEVGSPAVIAGPNEAVVAVAGKPGQFPPGLAVGNRVQAVDSGVGEGAGAAAGTADVLTSPIPGTVVAVDQNPGAAGAGAVVSLRVTSTSALQVARAAALGRVSLILIPATP